MDQIRAATWVSFKPPMTLDAYLKPLRKSEWVVYAKPPFGGPQAVLAYLARYTHRVAISNRRLLKADAASVTFRIKNYRVDGPDRYTTLTLGTHEFIRRFLIHVLPNGLHRIRHYGLLANGNRAANVARARELLGVAAPAGNLEDDKAGDTDEARVLAHACPGCGSRMIIIEVFAAGQQPRCLATLEGIDSS